MIYRAVVLCLGVWGALVHVGASQTSIPDRGMIGILREDGILVPFAAFRGTRWEVPWPGDVSSREIPVTTSSVPDTWWGGEEPSGWHVRAEDGTVRDLAVQAPAVFAFHCERRLGLRTDFKTARPPAPVFVHPYPKAGLAATAGVTIEPLEILDRSSREWTALPSVLARDFNMAEDNMIRALRYGPGWRHPVNQKDREKVPVTLEAWYRTRLDSPGATMSYIEAVRAYPPGPEDEGCGLVTMFTGWIFASGRDERPKTTLVARVTYCDREGALYMLPLGRIRLRDRAFWIYQLSGWDDEYYGVMRIGASARVEARYYAGGRGSCLR
jgi:hypothetical protein